MFLCKRLVFISAFFAFLTSMLSAQTFDFEEGLDGWQKTGHAFDGQPVHFDALLTDAIRTIQGPLVTLGGDYWRHLTYPVGQHGAFLIATGNKPLSSRGTLTSPEFVLQSATPVLSFLVGGSSDIQHERIELQVRVDRSEEDALSKQIDDWADAIQPRPLPLGAPRRDGDFMVMIAATGWNSDSLRQVSFQLPSFAMGRTGRVRIVDDSPDAHINVDFILFTAEQPPPYRTTVWGYADYHTHPMSYMAFGGLKGIQTLWGSPGSRYADYESNPSLVSLDIPHCRYGHGGGVFAPLFISKIQRVSATLPSLADFLPRGNKGGPEFADFPAFNQGAHQQMHITQIRRNYEGGLRLMVALTNENLAAEYFVSSAHRGHVELVPERKSLEAQLAGVRNLAALNADWMEIALSPEDARRIILSGKLAVVLGIEMDEAGHFGFWQPGGRNQLPIREGCAGGGSDSRHRQSQWRSGGLRGSLQLGQRFSQSRSV